MNPDLDKKVKINEDLLEKKAEKIYKLQRQIDELLNEIYKVDEDYGTEVVETLREELYKSKEV